MQPTDVRTWLVERCQKEEWSKDSKTKCVQRALLLICALVASHALAAMLVWLMRLRNWAAGLPCWSAIQPGSEKMESVATGKRENKAMLDMQN